MGFALSHTTESGTEPPKFPAGARPPPHPPPPPRPLPPEDDASTFFAHGDFVRSSFFSSSVHSAGFFLFQKSEAANEYCCASSPTPAPDASRRIARRLRPPSYCAFAIFQLHFTGRAGCKDKT